MTLQELVQEFERNYISTRLRPSTARGYRVNLRNHLLPALGDLQIEAITVDHLDRLTAEMRVRLSAKTCIYIHATLRKVLNYAIRRQYITRSPYDLFDLPRVEKFRYQTLSQSNMVKMLAAAQGTDMEVPVTLALCYGLRRGECLGVIPSQDLDRRTCVLHIQRTRSVEHGKPICTPCKTEKSNRLILMSEAHAEWLSATAPEVGQYACSLSPAVLDRHFVKFLKDNHFPRIRFHDLRHTYATFMLAKGVNPKIVSTVLGHSSVSVTLDIYSHPDVSVQTVCLQAFSDL